MIVVMYSNYLSIHQLPLCETLYRTTKGKFTFVATQRVSEERLRLGYQELDKAYPFVLRAYDGENEKQCALQLAEEADMVIHGSAPWDYLKNRLQKKKLTFLYSERIYKSGYQRWKWPVRLWRHFWKYGRNRSLYMLCASAYTAGDFAKTLTFLNRTYKWGYFPEVKRYENKDVLFEEKEPNTILWAGRFLDWKHPEHMVEAARRLKADGYDFRIKMLGNGEQLDAIRQQLEENNLQDRVQLLGAVPADEVRRYMEKAAIYLFTSDRQEGWGAVLNESMNSGCAVVACNAIGAVPFLLQDGENGLVYQSGNTDDLYEKVKLLLDNPEMCTNMGIKAYETMTSLWNAETAAERLMKLAEAFLKGDKHPNLYENGPCSKAEIL